MSQLDVVNAKKALAMRLGIWGVPGSAEKAAGFIDDLVTQGWIMSDVRALRPTPPKRDESCLDCGRHLDGCLCGGRVQRRERGDVAAGVALVRAAMGGAR